MAGIEARGRDEGKKESKKPQALKSTGFLRPHWYPAHAGTPTSVIARKRAGSHAWGVGGMVFLSVCLFVPGQLFF